MTTLTAHMFNRTIVTEHDTRAAALDRVVAIAVAQNCRIVKTGDAGQFVARVWAGDHYVDDPSQPILGTFEIAERFVAGQPLTWANAPACGGHSHRASTVSFRRYLDGDLAEVMTCRGSRNVPVGDLS